MAGHDHHHHSGEGFWHSGKGFWLDRAAILLSGLCLVHCAGSAALVALIASTGGAMFGHGVHEVGLALALAIGAVALGTGLCRHGALLPALVGAVGLVLMGVALMLPHGTPEMIATMIGVSVLAFGHHLNRKASLALS